MAHRGATKRSSNAFALARDLLFFACAKKSRQKKAQPRRRARRCAPGPRDSQGFSTGHPCPVEKRAASCRAPFGPYPRVPPLRWASKVKGNSLRLPPSLEMTEPAKKLGFLVTQGRSKGKTMPVCKMCGETKEKLIRCHIYPRSMSREISGKEHCLVSMSMKGEKPVSGYAPGGLFDDHIVCGVCETFFKEADDYGIVFRRKVLTLDMPAQFLLKTVRFPSFDASPEKLHRFAVQTWLRSHLSQRHENEQINNPLMANMIVDHILMGKETIDTWIQVSYMFFTQEIAQIMISPEYFNAPEFPVYSIWMPNMNIFISASDNGLPPGFSHLRLERKKPVTVLRTKKVFDSISEKIYEGAMPHYERLEFLFGRAEKKK
jgi:hypothetical protein